LKKIRIALVNQCVGIKIWVSKGPAMVRKLADEALRLILVLISAFGFNNEYKLKLKIRLRMFYQEKFYISNMFLR